MSDRMTVWRNGEGTEVLTQRLAPEATLDSYSPDNYYLGPTSEAELRRGGFELASVRDAEAAERETPKGLGEIPECCAWSVRRKLSRASDALLLAAIDCDVCGRSWRPAAPEHLVEIDVPDKDWCLWFASRYPRAFESLAVRGRLITIHPNSEDRRRETPRHSRDRGEALDGLFDALKVLVAIDPDGRR